MAQSASGSGVAKLQSVKSGSGVSNPTRLRGWPRPSCPWQAAHAHSYSSDPALACAKAAGAAGHREIRLDFLANHRPGHPAGYLPKRNLVYYSVAAAVAEDCGADLLVGGHLATDGRGFPDAAPGYFAIRFGKWLGCRTIWIDSIANVEQLSMAGQLVKPYADLWLTQWSHLAGAEGPHFMGAVL